MVAVPGRSKSCGTCRIRKKGGCDMKRPACGQCQKLGLKCDGYERETVFINITAGPSSADDKHRLEQASPQVLVLPDALARSAYEEKYLGIFWGIYLPQQKQFPPHVTRYTGGGWTNALPQLCSVSPPIRKVLLALCLTTAGRAETKSWEKDEGLRCYMSSLRDMSGTLARLKTADPTTLCVASRLYSLYEVLFGQDEQDRFAQARNWRKHIDGELAVVTCQSPQTYVSGYLHQLFVDGRFHLTTGAIQKRKKTVLSTPEWKTIPWREIPKTPKDVLIDIFVEMPTLLEDLDRMKDSQDLESREILRRDLGQRCCAHERELAKWRNEVGIADPTYMLDVNQTLFSLDLVAASHILCLYWSTCIIVYSTLQIISGPDASLPRHRDPRLYCRRIAEAVSVLLHPLSGVYGVHLANFPVAAALMYLNATDGDVVSEEKAMILDVFERSGHGRTVDRFIASLRGLNTRSPKAAKEGPNAAEAQAKSWLRVEE